MRQKLRSFFSCLLRMFVLSVVFPILVIVVFLSYSSTNISYFFLLFVALFYDFHEKILFRSSIESVRANERHTEVGVFWGRVQCG